MLNVPDWPADGPVAAPAVRVDLNGVQRGIVSASVAASVRSGDVAARTGSVEWAPVGDVFRGQDSVLSSSAPRRGDRVTVSAGAGDVVARLLTGRVDATANAVPGGLVSDLVDDFDLLNAQVDVQPLLPKMTPYQDGGPFRQVGLTATWPTQRVLAQCGFHATPAPRGPGNAVAASLNGSLWPEGGTLIESLTLPAFLPVPWGEAPHGFRAIYASDGYTIVDQPLEVSMLVAAGSASGNSYVYANWSGGFIRLTADGTRDVRAQISTGTATTVVSLSAAEMTGAEFVRLRVTSAGIWTLTNDAGVSKTATASVPTALRGAAASWVVEVPAGGRLIGGVNAGFPTAAGPGFTRSAVIDAPDGTLAASRAIVSEPARSVLAERADAEHARMWIDALGVFQWRSRMRWGTGTPVDEITDVDLLGYSMAMDYDSAYSGATVSHLAPRVETRTIATITLFQGSRQVLNAGDVEHTFIEVPADEDWPWVDTSMDTIGWTGDGAGFNRGRRSWDGAVRVSSDGEVEWWAYGPQGDYVSTAFETITARKWLHTTTVGTGLAADQSIELRTPLWERVAGTSIWKQWEGFDLPVIRGYARVSWMDDKRYATAATTITLPRLEHDCGWWVQGGAVQRLTDWLAVEYGAAKVTITGLSVIPDARREIGDLIRIVDSTYADLSATAVITGIRYDTSNGEAAQSLDVELRNVTSTRKTYADVQAQSGSRTYAQFQALIGAVTYSQQEAA